MLIGLKKIIFLFVFLILVSSRSLIAQQHRYHLQTHKKFEIPFTYTNGLIEVNIKLNGIPLKFIFDTGAEHTILSNIDILPLLNLTITKEIQVYGADFTKSMTAFITAPVRVQLFEKEYAKEMKFITVGIENDHKNIPTNEKNKGFIIKNTPILILNNDIFNFQNNANDIQGIIGASFFSNSIVKIDYRKEKLIIYPYNYNISLKGYKEIPVKFNGHKPIIQTQIKINNEDKAIDANILMDTGSSIPILFLDKIDAKFKLPSKTVVGQIGIGLGGNLMGYIGLIEKIKLGEFSFKGQISKFQNLDSLSQTNVKNSRDGILGNEILKKFTIIIDNFRKKLYFKPNKDYYKAIKYDKSGLSILSTGQRHNQFYIKHIIKDSPADIAGLKVKDKIYSAQYFNHIFWSHERLVNLMKQKENKRIRLKVIRNGKKHVYTFRLKDMLK